MPYKDKDKEKERNIRRRQTDKYKKYQRKYQKAWKLKNQEKWKEIREKSDSRPERKEYIRTWQNESNSFKKIRRKFIDNGGMRKWEAKRKKEDMNYVIAKRIRYRVRDALEEYTKTGKIWKAKQLGIDYKKIIEYLKPFPKDITKYHIDHIKPLCSFNFINEDGSTNLEEVRKAFLPENHQWLLARDNILKGQRDKEQSIYSKIKLMNCHEIYLSFINKQFISML
jgi:hypothetical protein